METIIFENNSIEEVSYINLRNFFTPKIHLKYYFHKNTNRLTYNFIMFKKVLAKKILYPDKEKEEPEKRHGKTNYIEKYFREKYIRILKVTEAEYIYAGSKLGAEDAALTALLTGGLYGVYGSIITVVSNFIKINNVQIEIVPIYNRFYFDFNFQCILKIKLVNAIKELFRFILWIIKEKLEAFKNERTSYMQSYDHSYAKH